MKNFVAIIAFFVVSCSNDPRPFTWGASGAEVTEAYCEREAACLGKSEHYVEACAAYLLNSVCVEESTCDVPLLDELAERHTSECVDALAVHDCTTLVYYGLLPTECGAWLAYWPEE